MAKAKPYPWQIVIDWATTIGAPFGCSVARSHADYEIAKVTGDGVSLVIYPHKTKGTGNYSARVRDNGSKDKARAKRIMLALKEGEGLDHATAQRIKFSTTFSWKNMTWNDLHPQARAS